MQRCCILRYDAIWAVEVQSPFDVGSSSWKDLSTYTKHNPRPRTGWVYQTHWDACDNVYAFNAVLDGTPFWNLLHNLFVCVCMCVYVCVCVCVCVCVYVWVCSFVFMCDIIYPWDIMCHSLMMSGPIHTTGWYTVKHGENTDKNTLIISCKNARKSKVALNNRTEINKSQEKTKMKRLQIHLLFWFHFKNYPTNNLVLVRGSSAHAKLMASKNSA